MLGERLLRVLGRLPLRWLHGLSAIAYVVAFRIGRWRLPLIQKNLAAAMPDRSSTERDEIASAHVRNLLDTTLESLAGADLPAAELRERVTLKNFEVLEKLGDRPYLIVGAHQGNWEWQLIALSQRLEIPVEGIYAPSPSPAVEANLLRTRSRFGIHLIPREDVMKEIAARLKTPRAIVLLADQNPRRDVERQWIHFLNQDTAFPVGLQALARLTKYPVVYQSARRVRRGHYEVGFELMASPPYPKEGSDLMAQYAERLEASIRANPDDWLWSYDRWRYPKPLYT